VHIDRWTIAVADERGGIIGLLNAAVLVDWVARD
jgi:hypothetical protein